MRGKIIILILILLGIYLPNKFSKTYSKNKNEIKENEFSVDIVEKLAKVDYFKYVSAEHVDIAKANLINSLKPNEQFYSYEDYNLGIKPDKYFYLDGENVDELDGFKYQIEELMPYFEKRGIHIKINEFREEYDPETGIRNSSITINERKYVIYNEKETLNGWVESPKRLAEILNEEFRINGSEEQIYLGSGGNDGYGVLLTKEQYEILDNNYKNKYEKPLEPHIWFKVQIGE